MPIRSELTAELSPFTPRASKDGSELGGVSLVARVFRIGSQLELEFILRGPLEELTLPGVAATPERRDRLWESTCFEVFLSEAGQSFYWELNVSPALHWNLYHFRAYREAQREEARAPAPRCERPATAGLEFRLKVALELGALLPERAHLDLGVTAILDGAAERHWAIAHLGGKPDFHLRDSFRLRV